MDTPYDPEAHYGNKRTVTWTGYKVHLTETCDAELPHLITDVQTTVPEVSDAALTEPIQRELAGKGLLRAFLHAFRFAAMRPKNDA